LFLGSGPHNPARYLGDWFLPAGLAHLIPSRPALAGRLKVKPA
jgi:hypothetical protein